MKILHTADLHLKEDEKDRWDALSEILKLGEKEKVDAVIFSGDFFDARIESEKIRPKLGEIFSENNFDIILLPGNHDQKAFREGLFFGGDAKVINSFDAPVSYPNLDIWGIPFHEESQEEILEKLVFLKNNLNRNKKNILLYHGELLDLFYSPKDYGKEGKERYMPAQLSFFEKTGFDYILAGHFHTQFQSVKFGSDSYFVYPGSPVSITKRETGRRKVNIFKLGESPEKIDLNTKHFEKIEIKLNPEGKISPAQTIEKELEKLSSSARALVRVNGFFDAQKIGSSEKEVAEELEKIKEKGSVSKLEYRIRDVSWILEKEVFLKFEKILEEVEKPKKDEIREMVIRAMSKAYENR